MMKTAGLKYIFFACSLFLLVFVLLLSRNAGISCDEVIHYGQSVAVYDYFASHGEDKSALNTPGTHLKYYGQSFDNIVTILSRWFNIEDIYSFRHYMSALAGWLTIFITALFAVWLSGYRSGIFVLLLFAVSPTFIGHSQNNLKDIPFALAYISGIFFSLKVIFSEKTISYRDILLLVLSTAFCISIRAGGLILICYLFLFFFVSVTDRKIRTGHFDLKLEIIRLIIIILVSAGAFILGILLWPFALQAPVKNVLEAYKVMAHFPSTFRQIFEGQLIWSDLMPWYYLPKSMLITIPVVVFTGLLAFLLLSKKIIKSGKVLLYSLIIFTILFPVSFVLIERSNLYSSWRQFLFVYPAIVLVAAIGFGTLVEFIDRKVFRWLLILAVAFLSIHPALFIVINPRYCYLYYNQLVGGLEGAYGNYETDYYYISQTEASEWLQVHLKEKKVESAAVFATSSVDWEFRNYPGIKTGYLRYEERSMHDWDYAIVANRYIQPAKLKNKIWPPQNAIHILYADDIPVGAVLQRTTKADYLGFKALQDGKNDEAIKYFEEALKVDAHDEMIFYNFARALYNNGRYQQADSVLKAGLDINPDFEPILMYLGNIAAYRKEPYLALDYYKRVIEANRKYFEAYVKSAELIAGEDVGKARKLLKECLAINPKYKPAISKLADTYRKSDPEIARKYDEIAATIK
ncbi:MAG: tetratricopeptide repeat protein [Bacteroidales bacterium]|jgi:tetratricopeptide (TPR) repeat protein|nr:tetratricopeptide repeat protein [Bacteroidales bacterium]